MGQFISRHVTAHIMEMTQITEGTGCVLRSFHRNLHLYYLLSVVTTKSGEGMIHIL